MLRFISLAVFALALAVSAAGAQVERPAEQPSRRTHDAVAKDLREEASKIATAELSPVFATLTDPMRFAKGGLTADEAGMARELETLVRDIIRSWLTRGLESPQPPSLEELSGRLGDQGKRLRARIVTHAEAITLQGILRPSQAEAVLKLTGVKRPTVLPGRNGPPVPQAANERRPAEEMAQQVRDKVENFRLAGNRAGIVFQTLLGRPGVRAQFPDGTAHLDRLHWLLVRRDLPSVDLTKEQIELCERLNKLAIDVWCAWMTRGLDRTPLPPQRDLAGRFFEVGERARDNIFAHAEAIALEGIATPEQADQCLMAVWERLEIRALLDPSLASRLRLSKWQRHQVMEALDAKQGLQEVLSSSVGFGPPTPRTEAVVSVVRTQQGSFDTLIWNVLNPAQARFLEQVLQGNPRRHQASGKWAAPTR